ncbi:hypothetical protein [Bifidobacterium miconisargentati]|uniref:hypothetical protein n=1 Tax=Bifidobacterium miconisargentati TaxID=2834437 RepID=UPI001BDC38C8|nr:hypothetical protein [Bifidobacterium miconisargentati]MBW3089217.1 hypothetical protein [Bifidobacterium miconisargentati]
MPEPVDTVASDPMPEPIGSMLVPRIARLADGVLVVTWPDACTPELMDLAPVLTVPMATALCVSAGRVSPDSFLR